MFLTKINKLKIFSTESKETVVLISILSNLFKYITIKSYKKQNKKNINFTKYLYKQLISKKILNSLFINNYLQNVLAYYQLNNKKQKVHSYILNINFLKSNIMIHLANTKGNVIVKNSSGIMNFKGKYKTKPLAFNTLLKKFKFKIRKIRNYKLAMHVLGIKKKRLIATRFKFFTFLGSIKSFNLVPFNGCREKKRKRKKNKRNLIIL